MFKPILITTENAGLIESALFWYNGTATAFTITTFNEVARIADRAEARLTHLAKADRVGAEVTFSSAGPEKNAYKYSAVGTRIRLRRTSKHKADLHGWALVAVERTSVYPRETAKLTVTISQKQRDALVRHFLDGFIVRAEPAAPAVAA